MVEFFYSADRQPVHKVDAIQKGCWINLIAPTEAEIQEISRTLEIELDYLKDPLDSEERSRIEFDEHRILMIVDIPIVDFDSDEESTEFSIATLPLGIIILPDYFITVCLKKTPILEEFKMNRIKNFQTPNRNQFLLNLLLKTSSYYLRYLNHVNRKTEESELKLQKSMRNQELFELISLEKTLVYFTTSLRANQTLTRKLMRSRQIKWTDDDEDLLEDVMIEFDQAIEMTQIYSSILNGLMDAFASVISNNLNMVMKLLTSITIVLAIPTMVSSFFGMNVGLPMQTHPFAFLWILVLTVVLVTGSVIYLYRKNLF